jgi:hypothetical protein
MQSQTTCPICGSSSIRTYVDAPNETLSRSSLGSSRVTVAHGEILRCQSCGFGFLASRMSEETLAQLYSELDHQIYESEAWGRARTAIRRRWPLLLPEHFNYFTRKSLALCAERAGFELVRFGRRPAFFTVGYIFHRLAKHKLPGATSAKRLAIATRLNRVILPVPLGETYGVWSS